MTSNEHEHNLPNFHAVLDEHGKSKIPWLFRGGQPTARGFELLKSEYSVETIICLRRDESHWEEECLKSCGLKFVSIPLPLRLRKLSEEDFRQRVSSFLQTITDGPRNIFVHSHEGKDRTGLMIALYRMSLEHWPLEEAFSEMESRGYHGFAHQVILSIFKDRLYDWVGQSVPAKQIAKSHKGDY